MPNITKQILVLQVSDKLTWINPILEYLLIGVELKKEEENRKLRIRVTHFVLIDDLLYKRSFSMPYLRCLTLTKAKYTMKKVYEGICNNHLEAQTLAHELL